jgi:hypothetical protein
MNEPVARFEFRVFGQCFDEAEQRLRALAPCNAIQESREIYLVGDEHMDWQNIKIRDGKLELKRLVERRSDLERWSPSGQWPFPIPASVMQELLVANDGSNGEESLPPELSKQQVLELATGPPLPLSRANVCKRRFRFELAGCRAEVDQLLVNGASIGSLAIESEDPDRVLELRSALRLSDRENLAYPLGLGRILGLRPLPDATSYG